MARLRRGDSTAYQTLLEECESDAHYFTQNRERQEELAQQTAIRILENIGKFDEARSSFKTWCRVITRRLWYDMTRREKRTITFTDFQTWGHFDGDVGDWFPDPRSQEPLAKMAIQETLDYIAYGKNTISQQQREILLTRHGYARENSIETAALALGIAKGTIKSSEHDARLKLKERLKVA